MVLSQGQTKERTIERKPKTAIPFHYIDKRDILFANLMTQNGSSEQSNDLVIEVDLKNVRPASVEEIRKSRGNSRTIHLEIITDASIGSLLNGTAGFGTVSLTRKRYSDVCSNSLLQLWSAQSQDHRYWLCQRSANGHIVITKYLRDAELFERFDDICSSADGGFPWVTLFKEEKKSHEAFQPIDKSTIIIFCKVYEPECEDISYLGHLLVHETAHLYELYARIAYDMADVSDGESFNFYIDDGMTCRDISEAQSTLEECKVRSGSVLVMKKYLKPEIEDIQESSDQVLPTLNDNGDEELDMCFAKQEFDSGDSLPLDHEISQESGSGATTETARQTQVSRNAETEFVASQSDSRGNLEAIREVIRANIRTQVTEPILDAINEVKKDVVDTQACVLVSNQELTKANLLTNIDMELLTDTTDAHLDLRDRAGDEAFKMADDYVKDEPIFVVNPDCSYRIRISLQHKHQSDCANYNIRFVSVKPSDGIELGLRVFETMPVSEGNEVVAFVRLHWFQSSRLSSGCPQFGSIEERYVSMAVTIGIDSSVPASRFELKGRILCHPVAGHGSRNVPRFRRFVSNTWKKSPQWMREAAKGAVILTSVANKGATNASPSGSVWSLGQILCGMFVLPCFRLQAVDQ